MTDPSHLRSKTGREPTSTDELLIQSFAKLHSVAFGIALGDFTGLVYLQVIKFNQRFSHLSDPFE